MASGDQLGYAAITSDGTSVANFGAETDITGLSVTVTVGARPIKVIFDCSALYNATANESALLYIKESTTTLATVNQTQTGTTERKGCHREVRLAPSAGSHTYKIMLSRVAAGTATITANATSPAFIQVVEL